MDKRKEMAGLRNALRLFVKANSHTMTDDEALSVASLHDDWLPNHSYTTDDVDKVVRYKEGLYRIVSAHTSAAHYPPDGEGLLALYRPIVVGHNGTLEDPIPYLYGMDVYAGLVYTYSGGTWIAVKDMVPCVWPPAPGNEWEVVA